MKTGFCITQHKGYNLKFKNGWSISVQWGPGNYTDDKIKAIADWDSPRKEDFWSAETAEIAVLNPQGKFFRIREMEGDDVLGYCDSDLVAEVTARIANFK